MKQQANRRWQFYLLCEQPGNLCKKNDVVISCRALALNEKENRTTKRWKLLKKKGKLMRVGANGSKRKDNRNTGTGNGINFRTNLTLFNHHLN